ncbi:MAG TPA: 16S rRNA (cytosine(967)-C(5))-methyltransferase RsmB [Terriglobales bacterium]|nr:16S rRNA (cytosine(967)-C(5))-methyltransferase RsmB [Terriglobales bacterium]
MPVSPARAAAFDILLRVDRQSAWTDELLHSRMLDPLSPADRALTTELVMGVLRWRSRLDAVLAPLSRQALAKLDAEVLLALRLAVYQLGFLDRVPVHAAVDESVELTKRAGKRFAAPFVNAVLRRLAKNAGSLKPAAQPPGDASELAEQFAHPPWLVERWAGRFGLETATLLCQFDQRPPQAVLRVDDPAVESDLTAAGIKLTPGVLVSTARRVVSGDVTVTPVFASGRVHFQDEASQLVALLVGGGRRILDCCAAPGGKCAAIATRHPEALVIATDLHPHRARLLRLQVRASNVRVMAADATCLPFAGGFDAVLADVPCTGTGTLARNPEIKWRLRPQDLPDLHARQVAILSAALAQVTAGGRVIYSTCSLEPEEDEQVVEEVLAQRKDVRLIDCGPELARLRADGLLVWSDVDSLLRGLYLRTLPGVHPCDGFFAAILERGRL